MEFKKNWFMNFTDGSSNRVKPCLRAEAEARRRPLIEGPCALEPFATLMH